MRLIIASLPLGWMRRRTSNGVEASNFASAAALLGCDASLSRLLLLLGCDARRISTSCAPRSEVLCVYRSSCPTHAPVFILLCVLTIACGIVACFCIMTFPRTQEKPAARSGMRRLSRGARARASQVTLS